MLCLLPLWGVVAAPFAVLLGFVGRSRAKRGGRHGVLAAWSVGLGAVGLIENLVISAIVLNDPMFA